MADTAGVAMERGPLASAVLGIVAAGQSLLGCNGRIADEADASAASAVPGVHSGGPFGGGDAAPMSGESGGVGMTGSTPGVSPPPSSGTTCQLTVGGSLLDAGAFPMCIPPSGTLTPCSDTSGDPHNCGACGHDCQGGPCANGTCQPCVLASEASVRSIAIDGSDLYFSTEVWSSTTYSNVAKVPLSGGAVTILASGIQYVSTVAVDGSAVYFLQFLASTSGSVQSMPLTGGTPTVLATFPSSYPTGMILDGESLYVNLYTSTGGGNSESSVVVVPANGGLVRPLFSGGEVIGVHDGVAYLLAQRNLLTVSVMGGATTTISPCTMTDCPFLLPTAIAFFGSDMYLLNETDQNNEGSIVRIPIGGGTETPMATCLHQPADLAVDVTGIYWGQNYELRRITAGSGSVLYTSPRQAQWSVHVDARAIYWVDTDNGASTALIMKLAK